MATRQPWQPEVEVSPDLARELIASQFPDLSDRSGACSAEVGIELLGVGWDNIAYRVNGAYVFRFPRRAFAAPLIDTEARLLNAIADRVPLPIPRPLFVGRPALGYPWTWAGYALLPGVTACVARLSDAERAALAEPLARFLRALHAVPVREARRWGAGPDTIGRLDIARRTQAALARLDEAVAGGLLDDPAPLRAALDAAPAAYAPRADTLVHGDLYFRHVLIGPGRDVAGVIDWGDLHLGDPALDLAIAHTLLPPEAHPAFRGAYGDLDAVTWQVARLRAIWHTGMVAAYGLSIQDADVLNEVTQAYRFLL